MATAHSKAIGQSQEAQRALTLQESSYARSAGAYADLWLQQKEVVEDLDEEIAENYKLRLQVIERDGRISSLEKELTELKGKVSKLRPVMMYF
jgi:predicted nuclease with TOPRIM domain